MIENQISQVKYIPLYSLFLFFISICGNFFAETLPCEFQKMIKKSIIVRYIFVFITLFFLVISISEKDILTNFIKSIIIFIWFCFLVRNTYTFFIINSLILFSIYLISIREIHLENQGRNTQYLERINNLLFVFCFILTLFGFFLNLYRKKKMYKKKFTFRHFFFENMYC